MKEIGLTQGRVVIIDDEDFTRLSQWNWYYGGGYARRSTYEGGGRTGKRNCVFMHGEIMAPIPEGMEVDHINGNKLDNRRCNLRLSVHAQNGCNRTLSKHNTSGAKGVQKQRNKTKPPSFRAGIRVAGKQRWLGTYPTFEEAASAYNKAAVELHGEFARLN